MDSWQTFTQGEGDGYGGPFAVMFAESPDSSSKAILVKVRSSSPATVPAAR